MIIDGARFRVNAIHIMSTEMMTAVSAGNTVVTKSNSSLMGKDIHNLSRTQNPYHHITFYVSQNTTTRQLNELKTRIDSFIRTKMKSDIRDTWFVLQGVDRECRMNISLFLGSVYSFSDNNAMWRQIHIINKQIREEVTKMGVQYKRFSANEVTLQFDAAAQEQPHDAASYVATNEEERRPHRAPQAMSRSQSGLTSVPRSPLTSNATQSHGMLVHGGRTSGTSTAIAAIIDASLSVSNAHHVHI